jgi:hypothetical protein
VAYLSHRYIIVSGFWKGRDRGEEGKREDGRNNHSCPVNFAGRASWNFQPYRSVFMHLQHFKAGVQM